MPRRLGNRFGGRSEVLELVLGQQHLLAVVGHQVAVLADEQHADAPLRQVDARRRGREFSAVVPGQRQPRPLRRGRMLPPRRQPLRISLVAVIGALRLDRGGLPQFERPEGQVDQVAPHVAQAAIAKVPPLLPDGAAAQVAGVKWALGGRAQPQVPIQVLGHLGRLGGASRPLRLAHPRAPDVHFLDLADRLRLDQFHDAPIGVASVNLRAHLRGHLGPVVGLADRAGFVHRMGHRLLAVHVLAKLHRRHRRQRMVVVRRADDHGVDVFLLEHLPPVAVTASLAGPLPGRFDGLDRPREGRLFHVAERHDVYARIAEHSAQVRPAAPSGPDQPDVDSLARRHARPLLRCGFLLGGHARCGQADSGPGDRRFTEEFTAVCTVVHRSGPFSCQGVPEISPRAIRLAPQPISARRGRRQAPVVKQGSSLAIANARCKHFAGGPRRGEVSWSFCASRHTRQHAGKSSKNYHAHPTRATQC